MSALPEGWRLAWAKDPEQESVSLTFDAAREAGFDAMSTAFWKDGPQAWGPADFPIGPTTIALESFPGLDDIWTLFMWTRAEQGDARPESWEAMCRYCADVRQGFWPDRVPPESAVQSVYLALAQYHLLSDTPDHEAFLDDAFALCQTLTEALADGLRLADDPILAGRPRFERFVSILLEDKDTYARDLAKAQRFIATIPAERDPRGTEHEVGLLALDRPAATQFKLWARTDPGAPGGAGYPLLLVTLKDGATVLSADPSSRIGVGWLAEGLTELERRHGDEDGTWYDGENHKGTLIAAPMPSGSQLSPEQILRYLRAELELRSPRGTTSRKVALASVAVLVVGLAVAGGASFMTSSSPAPEFPVTEVDTTEADPLDPAQVAALVGRFQAKDGGELERFALLAGVCRYPSPHTLESPCRDARAMRELLIDHYGYSPDNVLLMVDDDPESEESRPTARNLRLAIERFRGDLRHREDSSFLFFYSGHGDYRRGARRRYGLLQPAGFFRSEEPEDHRGLDMVDVRRTIENHVRSRHVLIVLDACRSGWAALDPEGGSAAGGQVTSDWSQPTEAVLTASAASQNAWADDPAWGGLSALTRALVDGLGPQASGPPRADENADRVVTDVELADYVRTRVGVLLNQASNVGDHVRQDPRFHRFRTPGDAHGQFLFVPSAQASSAPQ